MGPRSPRSATSTITPREGPSDGVPGTPVKDERDGLAAYLLPQQDAFRAVSFGLTDEQAGRARRCRGDAVAQAVAAAGVTLLTQVGRWAVPDANRAHRPVNRTRSPATRQRTVPPRAES